MASVFDKDYINECIELARNGISLGEIAKDSGADPKLMSSILRHHRISTGYVYRSPSYGRGTLTQYRKLYCSNGWSLEMIQSEFGIDRHFLSYLLYLDGAYRQTNTPVRMKYKGRIITSKYEHMIYRFKVIDNEYSAYWLGFLYADGSIRNNGKQYTIELALADKDAHHVVRFRDWISPRAPVKSRYTTATYGGKKYKSWRACIHSKEIVEDLAKLGCIPRKSLVLRFPTEGQVPADMVHHFMRGYMDGDGCVTDKSIQIIGTNAFVIGYTEVLYTLGISRCKVGYCSDHNYYQWCKQKRAEMPIIYNYLYGDATIFLERKHDKFKSIVDNCPLVE